MSAPTLDARSLLDLKANWDSYDADPVSEAAVRTANCIAAVPLNDGGIQIEMHAGGVEFEFEINRSGKVRSFHWEKS